MEEPPIEKKPFEIGIADFGPSNSKQQSCSENEDDATTAALFEDWKTCLASERPDVKLAATKAVLQLQLQHNRLVQCVQYGLIPLLAKNTTFLGQNDDETISVTALQALIHLSSTSTIAFSTSTTLAVRSTDDPTASRSNDTEASSETPANLLVVESLETAAATGLLDRLLEIALSAPPPASSTSRGWHLRVNLAMALMANLTRTEAGAVALVGRQWPDTAFFAAATEHRTTPLPTKPSLELLLARFLNPLYLPLDTTNASNDAETTTGIENQVTVGNNTPATDWDTQPDDPYQHFAAILLNATQTEAGRNFVMKIHYTDRSENTSGSRSNSSSDEQTYTVLQMILPQLRETRQSPVRRRGIAGTVRNCCLDRDSAWWLINVVQIHQHIMIPLAGPEELTLDEKQGLHPDLWLLGPDKVREPDHATRQWLVESLLLLLSTGRASRDKLRVDKTYVILKLLDMVEEHEDISEMVYDCVNYLRRDEQGTIEGSSDLLVDTAYAKLSSTENTNAATISAPLIGSNIARDDDFDGVD